LKASRVDCCVGLVSVSVPPVTLSVSALVTLRMLAVVLTVIAVSAVLEMQTWSAAPGTVFPDQFAAVVH
jgi:hypothetical protein